MVAVALAVALSPNLAYTEGDGPDYWVVNGAPLGDELSLQSEPAASAMEVRTIPHEASGLKNLGCRGGPTHTEREKMTPAERKHSTKDRWCRIEYAGKQRLVAAQFLKEI